MEIEREYHPLIKYFLQFLFRHNSVFVTEPAYSKWKRQERIKGHDKSNLSR